MRNYLLYVLIIGAIFTSCTENKEEKTTEILSTELVNNPESAADTTEELPVSKISFEEEVFDFGKISQGEKVNHIFKFKNTGEESLVISSAKGSCGCTVPKWPKEPIAPGGEGVVEVVFDSNGKSGQQHKTVTIVANTDPATTKIAIKGEIIVPETN